MTKGANDATIGADRTTVLTTDTVGVFFKVFIPATNINFKMHYDPEVFKLVLGSLECSFTQYYMNTDTPGVIEFRGSCEKDRSKVSTTVRFAFKPKKISKSTDFTLTDVHTNPISTLTIPKVTLTVNPAQIIPAVPAKMKDDTEHHENEKKGGTKNAK